MRASIQRRPQTLQPNMLIKLRSRHTVFRVLGQRPDGLFEVNILTGEYAGETVASRCLGWRHVDQQTMERFSDAYTRK